MNLEEKFSTLEAQLQAQHAETIEAFNALLSALGAPPPSPGATLADVVGALNQLTVVITGFRLDMAAQHTAQLAKLTSIDTTLNIINENASWNTKQLLLSLAALDPCKPCEIPSYELPPLDVTPVTVNAEHCKRMQALLYAILRFTTKLDIISSLGAGFNTETIKAAFTEILTEIGAAGDLSISLPSFNELLSLFAACIEYIASNVFAGNDLQSSFMLVKSDLLEPLYLATNANDGIEAYRAGIDASSLPAPIKKVLKAIGYISLFNLYYGDTPLDTTGFDGSICGPQIPTDCIQLSSIAVVQLPRPAPYEVLSNVYAIAAPEWTERANSITFTGYPPYAYDTDIAFVGNWEGWRIKLISGPIAKVSALNASGNGFGFSLGPGEQHIMEATQRMIITSYLDIGQTPSNFTIELCPPVAL